MEHKLKKWFDAAKHNPPIISAEEVRAMISNPPAAKGGFSTLQKGFFMGTILLVISGWLFWMNTSKQVGFNNQNAKTTKNIAFPDTLKVKNETRALAEQSIVKTNDKDISNNESVEEHNAKNASEYLVSDNMLLGNYTLSNTTIFVEDKTEGSMGIQLTNEELAALGIITDGNTLRYLNQYDTIRLDYGTKGNSDIYAFAMNLKISKEGGCVSSNTHKMDSLLKASSNSAVPVFISVQDVRETKIRYFLLSNDIPKELESIFIDTIKNSLIPISVKTTGKGVKYVHDNEVTFWYKNNKIFRSKLPLPFAEKLALNEPEFDEQNFDNIKKSLRKIAALNEDKYKPSNDLKKKNQDRFIVLSQNELKKFSVWFNTKKCVYKTVGYSNNGSAVIISLKVTPSLLMTNMMYKKNGSLGIYKMRENANPAMYVTDSNLNIISNFKDIPTIEEGDELQRRDMYKMFSERVDSLVPVLLLFDQKEVAKSTDKHPQTHLVFWFTKTEAFIKALPERIQKEMNSVNK